MLVKTLMINKLADHTVGLKPGDLKQRLGHDLSFRTDHQLF